MPSRVERAARFAGPGGPIPGLRLEILALTSNAATTMELRSGLAALACQLSLARTARQALALLSRRRQDVILIDLAPSRGGLAAAQHIRRTRLPWAQPPIAALTFDLGMRRRNEIAEAGMDAYVLKPIDTLQLAETLALLTRRLIKPAERQHIERENHNNEADYQLQRKHALIPSSVRAGRTARGRPL